MNLTVLLLNYRYSSQRRSFQFFVLTKTTLDVHGDFDGLIIPPANNCSMFNVLCLIPLHCPISVSFLENISPRLFSKSFNCFLCSALSRFSSSMFSVSIKSFWFSSYTFSKTSPVTPTGCNSHDISLGVMTAVL